MSGYLIAVDHRVFEPTGGGSFTLVDAVQQLRGVRNARVLRTDGTVVLAFAGSTVAPWLHVPTGRRIEHRRRRRP